MPPAGPDPRDVAIARGALLAAAAGGVYLLLRSRPVRRLLWRSVRFAAFTWAPGLVATQVRHAWAQSAPPPRRHAGGDLTPGRPPER
jgi:hypothetical protein